MRQILGLGAVSLGLGSIILVDDPTRPLPTYGSGARKASLGLKGVPASINRHTGKPHEHKREIARRTARGF